MDRTDLLNALRLVRDHCTSINHCPNCEIYKECKKAIEGLPEDWDLDDDV